MANTNNKPKTGMARLLQIAATKKPLVIGSVILSSLAAIASFIPYIAIYLIVTQVIGSYPDFVSLDAALLINYGWLAFAGVVGNVLLYFGALVCSHLAAFGTLYQLKVNFASHLARVPLGFHVLVGSGKLRKIMDENIEKVEEFIAHQLPDIVAAVVAPVVMVVILLTIDWRFGLAALVGVAISFVLQMSMYGKKGAKKLMAEYQGTLEDMNNAAVEYVRGISVVKAFRQTVYSFRRLRDTIKKYTDTVIEYTLSWENSMSLFTTLINNLYLFIVPVGIIVGMNAADYTGFASDLIFYLLFIPASAGILMKTMYVNSNSMRVLSGVESMDDVLTRPELPQPAHPKTVGSFDISFEDVFFSYDRETDALKGVSFGARQQEVTAIVGPSGGGKSTIAHLIPRFFDVTGGSIKMGGVDIREMHSSYLMDKVSFVFQDVFLFKQSIKDNIRMGDGRITDGEIVEAAKAAQCHEFVMRLPQGYDTVIGTKGIHLSGGEKQRLAIARAIAKDAPVVVLDEATAFADPENEHLIQKAFSRLMKNKTVIMIAHRLSTVRSANNIIVVSGGRVEEQGTHDELVNKQGRYRNMWNTYTKTASWIMGTGKEAVKGA